MFDSCFWCCFSCCLVANCCDPQIRMVPSSLHDASTSWRTGFQLTQFTVLVCPSSFNIGEPFLRFHMYTKLSVEKSNANHWDLTEGTTKQCTHMYVQRWISCVDQTSQPTATDTWINHMRKMTQFSTASLMQHKHSIVRSSAEITSHRNLTAPNILAADCYIHQWCDTELPIICHLVETTRFLTNTVFLSYTR